MKIFGKFHAINVTARTLFGKPVCERMKTDLRKFDWHLSPSICIWIPPLNRVCTKHCDLQYPIVIGKSECIVKYCAPKQKSFRYREFGVTGTLRAESTILTTSIVSLGISSPQAHAQVQLSLKSNGCSETIRSSCMRAVLCWNTCVLTNEKLWLFSFRHSLKVEF